MSSPSISEKVPWQNSIALESDGYISIKRLYESKLLSNWGIPPNFLTGGSHGWIPNRIPSSSAIGVIILIQSSN